VTRIFSFITSTFSNKSMLNLSRIKITKNFFVGLITTSLLLVNTTNYSLAKPSNWSYKLGDNLRFDFKGCTRSTNGEDLICVGNFRSKNGEVSLNLSPGSGDSKNISITDSQGSLVFADELRVGDNWSCRVGADCSGIFGSNLVFVEGIDYKVMFVFKEASLPSKKIALFYFRTNSFNPSFEIKVRNINVSG
jgi:hypothetical protein